jgi:hypothetical protein
VSFCTVTFLVLFLISVVSFPLAIAFFGASPSQSDINDAVREWKVLKVLETRIAADAPAKVNDEKFKACISALDATISANRDIAGAIDHLSRLRDSIRLCEEEALPEESEIQNKAKLRADDVKAERDKYIRENINYKVGAALLNVREAIGRKDAKVSDVVHALLSADLLLRDRIYDGYTVQNHVKLNWASWYIDSALLCFGISANRAYELKSPGALDEVLRDLGKQLSSYGDYQRISNV